MAKGDDLKLIAEHIAHIQKEDDTVEKLHELDKEQSIEAALKKARASWWKTTHTVCITATSAIITGFYNAGVWLYSHFEPIRIGVSAMINAMRGNQ